MSLDDVVKNIGIISRNNGVLAGMQASGDDARELRTLLQDTGALARETSERLMSLQRGQHASGMPARQRTMLNKLNKDFEFVLRRFQKLAQSSASSQRRPANNRRAAPPASSQDTLPSGSHDDPSATSERRGLLAAEQEEEQQVRRQRQEQIQARHNLPSAPMLHLSAWVQIAERLSQLLCELAQLACSVRSPPPLSQMARASQENVVERERAIKEIEVRWCPHTPTPPPPAPAHRVEPRCPWSDDSERGQRDLHRPRQAGGGPDGADQYHLLRDREHGTRLHPTTSSSCIASPPARRLPRPHTAAARARSAAGGADCAREGGAAAREPLQVAPALEDLLPHARLDHRESRPPPARPTGPPPAPSVRLLRARRGCCSS